MDTFMDKLAQRLTAQEMIAANLAADAEEMNQLKGRTKEYAECLDRMQKLVDESMDRLNRAEKDPEVLGTLGDLKCMLADLESVLEEDRKSREEKEKLADEKLEGLKDHVHREGVKIYRNVQAAVTEENEKQTESLKGAVAEMLKPVEKKLGRKLNALLWLVVFALLAGLGSLALQILPLFSINLF